MPGTILTLAIACERDTVAARQRARQIARLLGFEPQDQTRISTAVSEIARNAFNYAGGGRVEYSIEGRTSPQLFIIQIRDSGPGVRDLENILEGRYKSSTGMGMGILGARRLMDQFQIESAPGKGTTVWLKKLLPRRSRVWNAQDLPGLAASLAGEGPQDAFEELQHQNQELLNALEEIRTRQIELSRLNRELEDTNRGVVALYAELDEKADHLRRADELKSRFLSNMSHEFRSPLNSILALSGLLLNRSDGELTAEQEQQTEYIRRAARDLLDLVNDLLDLAKVEAGKVEAKPVEFRVSDLFAALRGMLRPLLLNQAVDLVFEDVDQLPRDVFRRREDFADPQEFHLQFTQVHRARGGSGIGQPGRRRRRLFGGRHRHRDRSRGPAAYLPGFRAGGPSHSEKGERDRPGVAAVEKTSYFAGRRSTSAEPTGNRIDVHRSGSAAIRATAASSALASESAVVAAEADTGSLPVLVLEDKVEMMMMYRSYLKNSGFQLIPASTIRDAQEVLERIRPKAIILDLILRAEDSWKFLAGLKQDARTRDIPVMIASTIEDQAKAFHLGADEYLLKPVERTALLERLRR